MGLNKACDMMSVCKQLKWKPRITVLMVILAFFLSGCSGNHANYRIKRPPIEKLRQDYIALLKLSGVQVAIQGESVKLIIPSDYLFKPRSANLKKQAYLILARVARFLPLYQTDSIQVSAYTDDRASDDFLKLLTERQAQVVINQLWPKHMDASMVYAAGYGSAYPISSNASDTGRGLNRRIEIGFRYFPVRKLYD